MKKIFAFLFAGIVATILLACAQQKPSTSNETEKTMNTKEQYAIISTDAGDMVVKFYNDVAPGHVANFKELAEKGFYDGTCFHRIIKGFMIQGGDPLTKDDSQKSRWGTGGPGYYIKAEFNTKPHVRGVLSMARAAHPDSAGSQFFICHDNARFLDRQYTAFGELISGDDVLETIANTPCTGPERSSPTKRINIKSVKIVDEIPAKK